MSAQNLLALCREHSAEVDDPKLLDKYPPSKLRQWKAQQLADFDSLRQGWSLEESDIQKLQQDLWIVNTSTGSVIPVGGFGGNAAGAGGGGGGVYGSAHSIGGPGGKGGDRIVLDGQPATAPGAGGGGAGVLGDGAIGNEGGGGGEMVRGTIPVTPGERFWIDIGEGGIDGQLGGNTSFSAIKEDGSLTPIFVAKGGKPGQPGKHGDMTRMARNLDFQDLEAGAGVTALLVADMVRLKADLATLLDAGWDTFTVQKLPAPMHWPVFLVFSLVGLATASVIRCVLKARNPDGNIVFELEILCPKLSEKAMRMLYCRDVTLEANQCGLWSLEVTSGDIRLARTFMNVCEDFSSTTG